MNRRTLNMSNIINGLSDGKRLEEAEWKTMHGAHILVDDKGDIKAGGPEEMRTKASKKEIESDVKDANKKSAEKSGLGKGLQDQSTPKNTKGIDKVIKSN